MDHPATVCLPSCDFIPELDRPVAALKGFRRIRLEPGQHRDVMFTITPEMMSLVDENGDSRLEPGLFKVSVGGCSPGKRGTDLGAPQPAQATFTVR